MAPVSTRIRRACGSVREEELARKLEVRVALNFDSPLASNLAGRARAFHSMVGGGMDVGKATTLTGRMEMSKYKTEGYGGHLEGKIVFGKPCIQDRRQKRSREHMTARRIRKMRKCGDCRADVSMWPNAVRDYEAYAFKRFLRSSREIEKGHRRNRPRFEYCPADKPFAYWLDKLLFRRPILPPELDHEPETWQPF